MKSSTLHAFTMDALPLKSSPLATKRVFTKGETIAHIKERESENVSLIQNNRLQGTYRRGKVNPAVLPITDLDRISLFLPKIDYMTISWC